MPKVTKASNEAKWHELRRRGFGGSDHQHLMNIDPYGCFHKLIHYKRDDPKDLDELPMRAAERGLFLEDKVLEIFMKEYPDVKKSRRRPHAKTVEVLPPDEDSPVEVPVPKIVVGNIDHPMEAPLDSPAVGLIRSEVPPELIFGTNVFFIHEAKTSGEHVFWKIKDEGLIQAYQFQPWHYLIETGAPFCYLTDYWPDGHMWDVYRIERDPEMFFHMLKAMEQGWAIIQSGNPPPRELKPAPTEQRCGRCPWRLSCLPEYFTKSGKSKLPVHSYDGNEEFCDIFTEYEEREAAYQNAKDRLDASKEKIKEFLERDGDREQAMCFNRKIKYVKTTRKKTDHKELKLRFPDEYRKFTTEYPYRDLSIHKPKGG